MTTNSPTDTNQASELFELCKKVYERTGWEDEIWAASWATIHYEQYKSENLVDPRTPLYTSDYLLEKLPKEVGGYTLGVVWDKNVDEWRGEYGNNRLHLVHSDTPLKALLKLTIALSEAGELND